MRSKCARGRESSISESREDSGNIFSDQIMSVRSKQDVISLISWVSWGDVVTACTCCVYSGHLHPATLKNNTTTAVRTRTHADSHHTHAHSDVNTHFKRRCDTMHALPTWTPCVLKSLQQILTNSNACLCTIHRGDLWIFYQNWPNCLTIHVPVQWRMVGGRHGRAIPVIKTTRAKTPVLFFLFFFSSCASLSVLLWTPLIHR